MGKYSEKLMGKKIAVIGGSSGIGFGAVEALLDVGAQVIIISSSEARVNDAVVRLNSPKVSGQVGDVRAEEDFTKLLISLAPLDHIVFSGVDVIKGLASELMDKKIRVNTVVPGLVQTELWEKLGKTKEEQKKIFEDGGKALSVGFVATPEHIAEAYLYTVRADYANGTLVYIDGGVQL
ncbi:hypothetical protein FKW77_000789 [Venturia effusa]|uniref:Uncharacterized protein n=1 Tax=Venturia effusa TaxID=50376 RepID=A0A517LGF2_9PEZI|nr:hypothetical protein FKW77_000789 [Venturia effusa]